MYTVVLAILAHHDVIIGQLMTCCFNLPFNIIYMEMQCEDCHFLNSDCHEFNVYLFLINLTKWIVLNAQRAMKEGNLPHIVNGTYTNSYVRGNKEHEEHSFKKEKHSLRVC